MSNPNSERIAALNDDLRRNGVGGSVLCTAGVSHSPYRDEIVDAVRRYSFNGVDENNPYGENDFGAVEVRGESYFFKVDYFDLKRELNSPDASDPAVTKRVVTIMHSDEY